MFKELLPRKSGYPAFYVQVGRTTMFRIYKVKHLFSTVGVVHLFEFYVSFRDLRKFKKSKYAINGNKICVECPLEEGNKILDDLCACGRCNVSKWVL